MSLASRSLPLSLAVLALAGCSIFDKPKEPPACPMVSILGDAAKMTRFRPGSGRDLTDVQLQAEVVGYHGSCAYDEKTKKMSVALQVNINAQRGPAMQGRKTGLTYFVAMPAFHPKPEAKMEIPVSLEFPEGADQIGYTDDEVDVSFTLPDIKELPRYEIFLGMQLDPDQLDYNRAQRAR